MLETHGDERTFFHLRMLRMVQRVLLRVNAEADTAPADEEMDLLQILLEIEERIGVVSRRLLGAQTENFIDHSCVG